MIHGAKKNNNNDAGVQGWNKLKVWFRYLMQETTLKHRIFIRLCIDRLYYILLFCVCFDLVNFFLLYYIFDRKNIVVTIIDNFKRNYQKKNPLNSFFFCYITVVKYTYIQYNTNKDKDVKWWYFS